MALFDCPLFFSGYETKKGDFIRSEGFPFFRPVPNLQNKLDGWQFIEWISFSADFAFFGATALTIVFILSQIVATEYKVLFT